MTNYTCKICGEAKPVDNFYSASKATCKPCFRARAKEYRAANLDAVQQKDRDRGGEPHRVAARRAYAATSGGRDRLAAAKRNWAARNPDKRAAHIILGNAVRDGRIEKPETCGECGAGGKIHAHHEDYTKPLSVEWLCPACHRKHHK